MCSKSFYFVVIDTHGSVQIQMKCHSLQQIVFYPFLANAFLVMMPSFIQWFTTVYYCLLSFLKINAGAWLDCLYNRMHLVETVYVRFHTTATIVALQHHYVIFIVFINCVTHKNLIRCTTFIERTVCIHASLHCNCMLHVCIDNDDYLLTLNFIPFVLALTNKNKFKIDITSE